LREENDIQKDVERTGVGKREKPFRKAEFKEGGGIVTPLDQEGQGSGKIYGEKLKSH